MKTVTGYSKTQIRLHWAVFVLIVAQFLFADGISRAFGSGMKAGALVFTGPAIAHMVGGSLILALALWRLMLRRERGVPPPPTEDGPVQVMVAKVVHYAIYAVLVMLPVTGALAWGGAAEQPAFAHVLLKTLLLALLALHVAGALFGQYVQKTGVLGRMMRSSE